MPYDRFMIAPINGGMQTDLKPWILPDDAFSQLNNAYIFRGRVRKRFGSRLMNSGVAQSIAQLYSRLTINIGTTDGAGNFAGTVPGTVFEIGQLFSIGTEIFTVYQTGAPGIMLDTGHSTVHTYNTTTGAVVITGATPLTAVYFYPATPVMGLITFQTALSGNDPTYAFDTQFAYQFTGGSWEILGPVPPAAGSGIWTGTDSQFFWGTTWGADTTNNLLFVVNNNPPDQIHYWNPVTVTWTKLTYQIDAVPNYLITSLILVVFKNRLIALNTTETTGIYTNRARWSAFGDPNQANGWRQDIPGKGNALDAATMEDIVSCEFIKDRLIVFFERSTWELVYTGNQAQPFTWQQINTELGAESTWSVVPFDKIALAVGNVGIHACNGSNVERIDHKIPDTVWSIHDGNTEVERVYGIRDYFAEQVYWTFPNLDTNQFSSTYPNKILVYNYKTGSWAMNDDSITAFGYFYEATQSAVTWDSLDITWDNTEITWDGTDSQALNQVVLAGNQEGFVFIVDVDMSENAPALQITNLFIGSGLVTMTVVNHNLNVTSPSSSVGDFVYLENLNGLTGPFSACYPVVFITDENMIVINAPDIYAALIAGQVYTGGGTISRLSRIDILTKQFNFYVQQDRNAAIERVDFLVDRTDQGEITVDYATSSASPQSNGLAFVAALLNRIQGDSVLETFPYALYPLEEQQDRLWHPVYLWAEGNGIQLRIYLSDEEMGNFSIATAPFQMHAMTFFTTKTRARLE